MKFSIVTYGTEGDTRPLVALSRGLINAGHEVRLLADRSTLPTALAHGVSAQALAGDMKATVLPGGALSKLMKDGGDVTQMAKACARLANENTASWMRDLLDEATGSDAIIFSGFAGYVGLSVAEHLRIPAVGAGLWPISPTREFASALLPPWPLPGQLNLLSHIAINAMMWRLFRKAINAARKEVCGQLSRTAMWRNYPVLYGISRHLVPQPSDWPKIWQVCGAWPIQTLDWQPPQRLSEFLAAGEAPIYVGFGSMGGFDRKKMLDTVIGAVAGRRTLFFPGWSGIEACLLPSNFFVLDETPHDWLFPRTAMVIHHGGAGTSHTAARAGVPSIGVPFAGDQFFWAGRLAKAGVSPKYVTSTKINAPALSSMIEFAQKPEVRERAAALGAAMAQEDGVAFAVNLIEKLIEAPIVSGPNAF